MNECQDINWSGKTEMACHNTSKEHKGDTQRDAKHLDLAQIDADGNHHRIEQGDVCHRPGIGKEICQPLHNSLFL